MKEINNNDLPENISNSLETRSKTTEQRKKKFIKVFIEGHCNVSKACKAIGISRNAYYEWLHKDDSFKKKGGFFLFKNSIILAEKI